MAYQVITRLGRRVSNYALNKAADYAYNRAKRKISSYFDTPTPKRIRSTPVSQRTHITDTQGSRGSMRFTPRKSGRTLAMTNLRRRLQRTPAAVRRRRRPALYGAASSKSAGFISTRQRVKTRGRARATQLGVVDVIETGGVLDAGANTASAGNTVAVGHCQFPQGLAHKIFWRAMIKKLAVACKMNVYNFEAPVTYNVGAQFQVFYRKDPLSAYTSHTYVTTATAVSLETIAMDFFNHFDNLDNAADLEFLQLSFFDKIVAVGQMSNYSNGTIFLQNASFVLFSKSTLKVQNRTIGTTGGDEDSVDNVPLYGKAFYGKGSGTSGITVDNTYSGGAATGFWCDALTGTMAKVPTEKWYQEVPQASHFRQVIGTGKVHLDPGHIKTSVLDGKVTISLNKLYRLLFRTEDVGSTSHAKAILGRFRFMMLEKMLNSVVGDANNSIKCAFEHNIRMGGYIKLRRDTETAQLNSVANLDNEI